jgi:Pyridoxamine 5'-phosphate oxidase
MPDTTAVVDLQQPGALKLLHAPDPARLAYTGPDGYPRVIPIEFLWNGTAVVVCTVPTAPKVAALEKHPHVALTIDTMGPPAKELLLRGTASIEIVDGVPPEYLAAAAKSTRGEELAAFEDQVCGTYKEMARITITPSWARFYDFGTGRLPTFLRRLDSGSAISGMTH